MVVRVLADRLTIEPMANSQQPMSLTVEAGKILATLINECAANNLDLSPLAGIPGTVGGAIVGNAGQGAKGIWIGTYVDHVTVLLGGEWRTYPVGACGFRYRDSVFKMLPGCIVWEAVLTPPPRPKVEVLTEVEHLLKKRFETQIHGKTAGSCFKSLPDGTSAWQLIDAAGLRGLRCGDVQISEKHANFLLNAGTGTFRDVLSVIGTVREKEPRLAEIEMRLYGKDGCIVPL
ncbi:FAD-binding protein [Candidatus Peregrinibacteria bacterium]|nr:FAD-binding protein [Candidatus Peregrinibacteria bacterium]